MNRYWKLKVETTKLKNKVSMLQEQMDRAFIEIERLRSTDYTGDRTQ